MTRLAILGCVLTLPLAARADDPPAEAPPTPHSWDLQRWACDTGQADACDALATRLAASDDPATQHQAQGARLAACEAGHAPSCVAAADDQSAPLTVGHLLQIGCEGGATAACTALEERGWRSQAVQRVYILPIQPLGLRAFRWTPDGAALLVAERNRLRAVDPTTGQQIGPPVQVAQLRPFVTGAYGLRWLDVTGHPMVIAGVSSGDLVWTPMSTDTAGVQLHAPGLDIGDRFALRPGGHDLLTTARSDAGHTRGYDLLTTWSLTDGSLLGQPIPIGAAISSLQWATDGQGLAIGLQGGDALLLDGDLLHIRARLQGQGHSLLSVRPDLTHQVLYALDSQGDVIAWDLRQRAPEPRTITSGATAMQPVSAGLVVMRQAGLEFIDPATGEGLAPIVQLGPSRLRQDALSTSPDGARVAVGGLGLHHQIAVVELGTAVPAVDETLTALIQQLRPIPEDALDTHAASTSDKAPTLPGRDGRISGRVMHDGEAIRNAEVVIRSLSRSQQPNIPDESYQTTTDAQGRYSWVGLLQTIWSLEVIDPQVGMVRRQIDLRADPIWTGEISELQPTALMTGAARLPDGAPAIDAVVTLRNREGFHRGWVREDGSYSIPYTGRGEFRIDARHRSGATLTSRVQLRPGQVVQRDLRLKPKDDPDVLRVHVQTDTGEPVKGARIRTVNPVTLTDAEGMWWGQDLGEADPLDVYYDHQDWAGIRVSRPFPDRVEVSIPTATVLVRHQVWPDSRPALQLTGSEQQHPAGTAAGTGTLYRHLQAGSWDLLAAAPDGRLGHTTLHLEPGQRLVVDAPLAAGSTVQGHLLDASGAPIVGARVETTALTLTGSDGFATDKIVGTRSDPTGLFSLAGLGGGVHVLRVILPQGDQPLDESADPSRLVFAQTGWDNTVQLGDITVWPDDTGWPGVSLSPDEGGARVTQVARDGAASGLLHVGDRLAQITGRATEGLSDDALTALLQGASGGELIVVDRRGERRTITLPPR